LTAKVLAFMKTMRIRKDPLTFFKALIGVHINMAL